jgi:dTDP-glucose 4,6-dehydratase
LEKGKEGETYCVGGMADDISNLDVVKKIIKILGKNEDMIEFVKDRPGHDRRYAIDSTKIQTELGWKPEFQFDYAIQKTIDWYLQNKNWWERIISGEYQKYYNLQYTNRS